ncbi:hypothetical protein EV207_11525 [Scopulibacillus darangshiensis]|uniref:Uncharacterized protein n=1 Tax=Scopulibacillus darangshiensis TaxID=442528 RepID=A0A4R2P256_9BACL|nr:hypothetical protein [Scopulibacillus darangshiensis]TCP28799.1 hypothetical protein EV207_11525 [Scopulibacillus darangshiensis]
MEKGTYLVIVECIKKNEQELEKENIKWNNHICWFGTPEEQQEHFNKTGYLQKVIKSARQELAEG